MESITSGLRGVSSNLSFAIVSRWRDVGSSTRSKLQKKCGTPAPSTRHAVCSVTAVILPSLSGITPIFSLTMASRPNRFTGQDESTNTDILALLLQSGSRMVAGCVVLRGVTCPDADFTQTTLLESLITGKVSLRTVVHAPVSHKQLKTLPFIKIGLVGESLSCAALTILKISSWVSVSLCSRSFCM